MSGSLHLEKLQKMTSVAEWLRHASSTKQIVEDKYTDLSGDELLTAAIKENVLVQLDNLRTHPAVASKLAQGQLNLLGWVYAFESDHIFNYEPEARKFVSLTDSK